MDNARYVAVVGLAGMRIESEQAFADLLELVAECNPDFYEVVEGRLERAS